MIARVGVSPRARRAIRVCLRTSIALGAFTYAHRANAQPAQGTPVCVPGTTICGWADGRGGIQMNASGNGSVGPGGVNASGQAGAQGNANANANGNANGSGDASQNGDSGYSGGGSHRRSRYNGRFGVGVAGCPIVRVGIWSGVKAGGCVAVSFRWEALTFEMETQLLYGGTTHAFDWTFPMSFIIPLANESSLFDGAYLRFGGSPFGATFAHKRDGGNFVRFGLFAGAGYELEITRGLTWRVIDARVSFDMGTRRAMDRVGNWLDLGLQVGTGLVL
jgi:hypothetical protein